MKHLLLLLLTAVLGIGLISCNEDAFQEAVIPEEEAAQQEDFAIPEIPDEIASKMTEADIRKFQAGPGEEYLNQVALRRGHWRPVLMLLDYHLQFVPIGGSSCLPGEFVPCFGPGAPADPTKCLANMVGSTGSTIADGYWFQRRVHSEYYPVFCLPDYSGYGTGFHETNQGQLWLDAVNDPFQFDEEGNFVFYRYGQYLPDQSTRRFEGATGWEVAIIYTAAENAPEIDPNGEGLSSVLIFGWVYY